MAQMEQLIKGEMNWHEKVNTNFNTTEEIVTEAERKTDEVLEEFAEVKAKAEKASEDAEAATNNVSGAVEEANRVVAEAQARLDDALAKLEEAQQAVAALTETVNGHTSTLQGNADTLQAHTNDISDLDDYTTQNAQDIVALQNKTANIANAVQVPFSFGLDSSGRYGYKKAGADTVYPFRPLSTTIKWRNNRRYNYTSEGTRLYKYFYYPIMPIGITITESRTYLISTCRYTVGFLCEYYTTNGKKISDKTFDYSVDVMYNEGTTKNIDTGISFYDPSADADRASEEFSISDIGISNLKLFVGMPAITTGYAYNLTIDISTTITLNSSNLN